MEHGQEDMDKCGIVLEYKVSCHCTYITYIQCIRSRHMR